MGDRADVRQQVFAVAKGVAPRRADLAEDSDRRLDRRGQRGQRGGSVPRQVRGLTAQFSASACSP
jgi:hypothetical protein